MMTLFHCYKIQVEPLTVSRKVLQTVVVVVVVAAFAAFVEHGRAGDWQRPHREGFETAAGGAEEIPWKIGDGVNGGDVGH